MKYSKSLKLALIGCFIGLIFGFNVDYNDKPIFMFCMPLSVFITSFIMWYIFVERQKKYSEIRGTIVGFFIGLLSHPVLWYIVFIFVDINEGGPSLDVYSSQGIIGALFLSIFSLTGLWYTPIIGAIVGYMYIKANSFKA